MTAKVTLSIDKLGHVAETRISSGDAHLEAKEVSDDMYTSISRVIDKLESQIRGAKGAAQSKKRRSGDSIKSSPVVLVAPLLAEEAAPRRASSKAVAKKAASDGESSKKR
jgi:putative sigma-54 modulation protein